MVTVTVVGVLASIAIPHYHSRVAKAQTSEAMSLIDAEKVNVTQYMLKKNGCGTISNNPVEGKYGSIEVTGNLKSDAVQYPNTLQGTGCLITYTFKSDGVSKRLAGKKITAELFNNSTLSKATSTNVGAEYLSPVFVAQVSDPVVKPTITTETPLVAKDTVLIPVEAGTPEIGSTTETNCVKYQAQMICSDMGTYSCDVYNGNRRNGVSFYLQGEANNRNLLQPAALKMFSFIMRNGRCPATRDENYSTAVMGVGMSCHTVDISKLQLNTSCPAVD